MNEFVETIIIGGGQAGLTTAYHLGQLKRECIVFEQAQQAANAWRNDRWDSFTLLTPNWAFHLPGAEYEGNEPDSFMGRMEVIGRFEHYIQKYKLPLEFGRRVTAVDRDDGKDTYRVTAGGKVWTSRNVVIATGLFQRPKIPAFSTNLPDYIQQLHSGKYRNPQGLPQGAVLVVGSGQSGCQIAEELHEAGRQVYLSIGSTGRVPRRYRGRDTYRWLYLSGFMDRTVDSLPNKKAKFASNPHVSGLNGGRTINLHKFSRDGIILLGRLENLRGDRFSFAPDLRESLARVDLYELDLIKNIDDYISERKLDVPPDQPEILQDGFNAPVHTSLDMQKAGITTIIWATGYQFDFNLVHLPVSDEDGYPIQKRGVSDHPGLYFVGLPWLYKQKSGLLLGVGEDAGYIANHIVERAARES